MLNISNNLKQAINSKTRRNVSKLGVYNASGLVHTFTNEDNIKTITIERVGENSKFFGFGVTTKIKVELINKDNAFAINTENSFKTHLGTVLLNGLIEYTSFPKTFVTEVNKDEISGVLSITSYDGLENLKKHYYNEVSITNYTISELAAHIGELIGYEVIVPDLQEFSLHYETGANFEGTETLKDIFDDIAEATGTIYFINASDQIVFKRLDKDGEAVKTIDKEFYFNLTSKDNRRLQTICNATELGDNVSASTTQLGTTQYIRDNGFLDLREDIDVIVTNLVNELGNFTINQFECEHRGDISLEIGDKIGLETREGTFQYTYILDDVLTYNGALNGKSQWVYEDSEEDESNSANLGEALKQTFAKVDKANKQVEIMASEVGTHTSELASLKMNTESITSTITQIESNTNASFESVNASVDKLTKEVNAKMTSEEVSLQIKSELENGVSKVTTSTGFTFDENGLTVSKSNSEMETNINEDGMIIYKDNEEMLKASNEGVTATDLHARTYLIIGKNSRFEDYDKDGEERTACFWIGGD